MIKVLLNQLVWNDWNIEHIKKHSLTPKQVEESILKVVTYKKGYNNRLILIGRSGNRIISTILSRKSGGKYYVVTARDADKKERRKIYEKEKNNSKI
ncbi:hypothetical protein COW98_04245 [Candidatus Roizmanbacteria bacterium CG22_combo_CG10-13_8_21_14_all_35_9]|uniref:BrnT family toxin n=4 Tax=Candidatus Roizmaniibacteriota TaxID=1752723 RepID=A0A2M8F3H5_9BACT|nr:MAG: hypothetical protein COX47_03785 [Candidatus Roizmanbacteria bacterium CG23_combo_of_CG06-09_8_20_14_all_35_49]PIP62419.1 MAG: hypothetical protein COW98_04245 [Candidatus Roizmanbacteria bacterium CG22_combo_CG10-13_8_21_14_all_35_9]PIY71387.1 MAG: hypothetical protein COY88_00665 [Candidatus Roizmanbacteria bacterium CG_4_10_14_0_8_um_filter_35_28]PJC33811.1 MAG: hypothetical protein CO048_02250 [Candidatus Roizmanbacteria bacterium CG_4_9_14_0_2_um_filter_35_15]PJC82664.1 MAG: hypoth